MDIAPVCTSIGRSRSHCTIQQVFVLALLSVECSALFSKCLLLLGSCLACFALHCSASVAMTLNKVYCDQGKSGMAMYSQFEKDRDQGNFELLPELHAILSGMKVHPMLSLALLCSTCDSFFSFHLSVLIALIHHPTHVVASTRSSRVF